MGVTKKYVMALDQGTTSSRCIIFDEEGVMKSVAQREFTQFYPHAGWVEHDPKEIWSSQYSVMMEAMAKAELSATQISAIGIANQRETTIVWDKKTGEPVYPAIVWQCRRTSEMIDQLKEDGYSEMIRLKTGLIPDAYFSASKISWILENVPGARARAEAGELLFGTVDTWLMWKLSDGAIHATDYTNASRTMLYNILTLSWDEELLALFQIPKSMMPTVRPSSFLYGQTSSRVTGSPIPIAAAAGDQQSALFGQCCFEKGQMKNTYGTGCFLLMNTGKEAVFSENGLVTTITAGADEKPGYALEGSVFVAGAALQWLRDEMELIKSAPETDAICRSIESTDGVYLVPAFTGLGAPHWNQYARGTVIGLTRGTKRAHFIRAAVESLAYQVADVARAMEQDCKESITSLQVDGGASANSFLMQFQADILQVPVIRPQCIETTALGAAYLAGLACGVWKDQEEVRKNWKQQNCFTSAMDDETRTTLLKGWRRAVRCAIAASYEE